MSARIVSPTRRPLSPVRLMHHHGVRGVEAEQVRDPGDEVAGIGEPHRVRLVIGSVGPGGGFHAPTVVALRPAPEAGMTICGQCRGPVENGGRMSEHLPEPAPRDLPAALRLAGRLVPGIPRVHAQAARLPRRVAAVQRGGPRSGGPPRVALGDSMSQGIGARSIDGGWVGQLHGRLDAAGVPLRLVNLSRTGARVQDVVRFQLPELAALGRPALVTVLAGANDMFPPARRAGAVPAFAELLTALPTGRSVVGTLPRRNRSARAINALVDAAAGRGDVRIADMRGMTVRSLWGTRAEDLFHPNERGYAWIAGRSRPPSRPRCGGPTNRG